jgi:hypothetical protein
MFRYIKFTIFKCKNSRVQVQFSELNFYYNNIRIDYATASASSNVSNWGDGNNYNGIDNNVNTKFGGVVSSFPVVYTIDFGKNVFATTFNYITGNDSTYRDPISWTISVSLDNITYTIVNTENDVSITDSRLKPTQLFNLSNNPVCYNKGTKILTIQNNEEIYQTIETLKPGDIVKVYPNSFKSIKYIGYKTCINDEQNNTTMYIMKKTNNNDLLEDLIVSGLHYVYDPNHSNEPNIKIEDKTLIEVRYSKLFTKVKNNDVYTYYHLVLDDGKHYGIWANGLLSESCFYKHFLEHGFTLIEK